jgi:hypothetical protein
MTTNQISKSKLTERITALFLALIMTACSVTPVSTPSPSAPPATEAIPTPTEIALELEGEVYSTLENLPEEIIPSMELFTEMAESDGLDINELHPILWLKAAQGELSVNYALLQVATVTDLTDPDSQLGNPKPVYYIAYRDEQGQMQASYVLGKIIEKDSQGVSYVARMLSEDTFRDWQNNTQPEDGSYTVGQVVYSVPLREDISVEQARTMQTKLNSGELSSEDFMENYAEGVAFIQPGQEKQVVGIYKDKSTPELMAKPFWQELFSGVTEAQAAGLEFSSEPEPTPTPIPTLSAELTEGIEGIPDPRITNPELFDLTSQDAPIPQFVNAMEMEGIEITSEEVNNALKPQLETPNNLPPFITYRTSDGVALIMATRNLESQEWEWKKAIATEYWRAYGKYFGYGIKPRHEKYASYLNPIQFKSGLLALTGALENGGPIEGARDFLYQADQNDMAFFMHYVVEPGKYPDYVNTENVDKWLDNRLNEIAGLIKRYNNSSAPVYISINEPWHYKNPGQWNSDRNPLRDKYGDNWLTEYVNSVVQILTIEYGLKIGEDYLIVVNDDTGLTKPSKIDPIYNRLSTVAQDVYKKHQVALTERKITNLQIILGLQVGEDEVSNTIERIAVKFADLGGIILTEVNPEGSQTEVMKFLENLSGLVDSPNIHGLYIWKVVPEPDPDEVDSHPTLLLDGRGDPTVLYYQFLR